MKKLFATALAAVVFFAQMNGQTIRGRVLDENHEPIEFATVALCSLPDSTVIAGSVSDAEGAFELISHDNTRKGFVKVAMIGYITRNIALSDLFIGQEDTGNGRNTGNGTDSGKVVDIMLSADKAMLAEAVVSAVLPKTELKGNAVVTNIAGSVLEHSGNALDVLGKIPGMISKGGGLEVIGRGAPVYYLNGRKITDASELRNLMSEDIKSIDVISNPGAVYGGEVRCVVRIRTVKHQGDGLSYALTSQAQQRIYDCHDTDPSWSVLDLNYRKKGVDLFGKFVYWNQRSYQISDINGGTIVNTADGITDNLQKGTLDYRGHNGGFQYIAGVNWQLNEDHSLGFKLGYDHNTIDRANLIMDEDVYVNGVQIDHLTAVNKVKGTGGKQWSGNLYYDGAFDDLKVNFNADFVRSRNGSATSVSETGWGDPVAINSSTDNYTGLGAGKLVLSYPVWKGTLQAGTEETYVTAGQSYNIDFAGIPSADASLTENTIAGFAEYSAALPFGQISAGLRFEHAGFRYDDDIDITKFVKRTDNNWFPSFSFTTKVKEVGLNLSYTGKTVRPNYSKLSNEITYDNKFSYQTGDPLLKNEVHRTLALNANYKWLTFSGNYERVDNTVNQNAYPYNDEGVVMIKYANFKDPVRILVMYVNASPTIGIWYPRFTVGVEKQFFKTVVLDPRAAGGSRELKLNDPVYMAQVNNTLRFKSGWNLDMDYKFVSPGAERMTILEKPLHQADIAISRSFLKNEALNFRLSWNDIFNSYVYHFYSDFGNCYIRQSNNNYSPCIQLRVSYRFNSAQNKYKGTGAGQSAKDRF